MIRITAILLLAVFSHGIGPTGRVKDPVINDEFEGVYREIQFSREFIDVKAFPKATILALTPERAGRIYYCSDCATDAVCVSTGTSIGAFSRISARTTACQ